MINNKKPRHEAFCVLWKFNGSTPDFHNKKVTSSSRNHDVAIVSLF